MHRFRDPVASQLRFGQHAVARCHGQIDDLGRFKAISDNPAKGARKSSPRMHSSETMSFISRPYSFKALNTSSIVARC